MEYKWVQNVVDNGVQNEIKIRVQNGMQKLTFIVFISHDLHPSIFVTNGQSRCISMNIPMFTMVPMQSYHLSWLTNIGQALNIQFCLQKKPNLLKSLEIQFRELRNICGTYHETSHGIINVNFAISDRKQQKSWIWGPTNSM